MENSKKFLSLGLSALSILPIGALLSSNINAGAVREQEEQQGHYYTITFDLNGGTYNGSDYIEPIKSEPVQRLGDAVEMLVTYPRPDDREGYKFIGWQVNDASGTYGGVSSYTGEFTYAGVRGDMHVTAVWESTAVDYRLQKVDEQLSSIEKYINTHVGDIESKITYMRPKLNYSKRFLELAKRATTDAVEDYIKPVASSLLTKCESYIKRVDEAESDFGRSQRMVEPFMAQVSHARQMLNSANDGDAQYMIDELESLVSSLENEMVATMYMDLGHIISELSYIEQQLDEFGVDFDDIFMTSIPYELRLEIERQLEANN